MKTKVFATNIEWDLSDVTFFGDATIDDLNLPTEVEIPSDIDSDRITDYLSDEYGFLVEGYNIEIEHGDIM
jgi:hypothetical protein